MFKNKRNLSRVLRVHSSVFVCLFLFILPVSADSFLQYVGEAFVLPPPTAPSYNAEVNSWSYSSSSKHIEVTNKGTTSPGKAVITSYFSGTETIECFYSVNPSNARYTVEWLSSDKSVATVSSSGLVTAVSTGRTTIKVRTDNGKVATCEVNVTEQQFYDLVVWLKNGEKNMFRLSEHPVVSYADGAFILKTSRTEAEYKASSVRKFTLLDEKDDPAASVQEVKEKPNSHVYYSEDVVEMTGGKPNSRGNVYRLDGKRADTMETDAEGNLTFSVAQYPAGTYIIESETITFKISKR